MGTGVKLVDGCCIQRSKKGNRLRVELNVLDYLERAALVYPDRIAIVDEPSAPGSLGEITNLSLYRRARNLAKALEDMGVEQGERVAIFSPNSAKMIVSLYGVSGFGRTIVPINFRLTPEEVTYIIEHSGASVLLVDPDYEEHLASITVKSKIIMDGVQDAHLFGELADDGVGPKPWASDESFTCSINYTSGTTARPKGVQITHRNMWLNAAIFGWHAGVTDEDVYLHTLPLFHVNGWGMPYAITGMGGRNVILRKVDGEEILRRIEVEGVNFMCGAPAVWAAVLQAAEKRRAAGVEIPGRDLVRIVAAGAPPPSKTIERIERELGWRFMQIYGLTETSPVLTFNKHRSEWDGLELEERAKLLSRAGGPVIGTRIHVDSNGEVLVKGNQVFEGYWDNPTATADALEGGWFHTGDGGFVEDGYLTISDRKKDVIITGGENVSSIEVEDIIFQHPQVVEVAVIGVPDEKWGETIKALVVLRPDSSVTEADIVNFCRERLAHFKCPTTIEFRDELARTATGKLQKFKLRAPYWEGRTRLVN